MIFSRVEFKQKVEDRDVFFPVNRLLLAEVSRLFSEGLLIFWR